VPGPPSINVTVNVTVSPTFGVESLTAFVTARSACSGVSVAKAVLLAGFGSNWSACEINAAFVCALAEATVAWIVSVCGVPVVTVPTSHRPVPVV
jgi:hypothetical protein